MPGISLGKIYINMNKEYATVPYANYAVRLAYLRVIYIDIYTPYIYKCSKEQLLEIPMPDIFDKLVLTKNLF